MNATNTDPRTEYKQRLQDAWLAEPEAWRDVPEPKAEASKRDEYPVKLLDAWLGPESMKAEGSTMLMEKIWSPLVHV